VKTRLISPRVTRSVALAGICALVFAAVQFFFFLFTAFLVKGDGSGPAIARFSGSILQFTQRLLKIEPSIPAIALFWSLVLFFVILVLGLLLYRHPSSNQQQTGHPSVVVIAFVAIVAAVGQIFSSHGRQAAENLERHLAVEFVRNNADLMQMAGADAKASLLTAPSRKNIHGLYDIALRGDNTFYVIVEVSRDAKGPTFTLLCTTKLYLSHRDVAKHPCQQEEP
jgi:hypothetical protein